MWGPLLAGRMRLAGGCYLRISLHPAPPAKNVTDHGHHWGTDTLALPGFLLTGNLVRRPICAIPETQ